MTAFNGKWPDQEQQHEHDELMVCKTCMIAGWDSGRKDLRYGIRKAVEKLLDQERPVEHVWNAALQAVLDLINEPTKE